MEKINLHNYEAFYLDYLEGNLDAEHTAQLLLFLEQHPHLEVDFDAVQLEPNHDIVLDKSALKQNIDSENIDHYLIARLEGELDGDDEKELEAVIASSPKIEVLAKRYERTILAPPAITFPMKDRLKRKSGVIVYLAPMLSAAAVALIFFLIPSTTPTSIYTPRKTMPVAVVQPEIDTSIYLGKDGNEESVFIEESDRTPTQLELAVSRQNQMDAKSIDRQKRASLSKRENEKEQLAVVVDTLQTIKEDYAPVEIAGTSHKAEVNDSVPNVSHHMVDQDQIAMVNTTPKERQMKSNETKVLKLNEWANRTVRQELLGEEQPSTEKVAGNDLFAAVVNKLNESPNVDITYSRDEVKKRTAYSVTVGKFKFSRIKKR